MSAFQKKSVKKVRREIDRSVRWQVEGVQDGRGTASDAIHICATANKPSEILYFLQVASDDAIEYAAEYLTRLRTDFNFFTHPYIGQMTPEESRQILQALQPVYRQIHDLFFAALEQRRSREESKESPKPEGSSSDSDG